MPKQAVSVTLEEGNVLWLKGLAKARRTSLSQTLDEIVSAARPGRQAPASGARSVVGTVEIAEDDPDLSEADAYVRARIEASLARFDLQTERPAGRRRRSPRGRSLPTRLRR